MLWYFFLHIFNSILNIQLNLSTLAWSNMSVELWDNKTIFLINFFLLMSLLRHAVQLCGFISIILKRMNSKLKSNAALANQSFFLKFQNWNLMQYWPIRLLIFEISNWNAVLTNQTTSFWNFKLKSNLALPII